MAQYTKFEASEPTPRPPIKQTQSGKPHQTEQPSTTQHNFNFCGICGQKMPADWNFCTSCGTKKPRINLEQKPHSPSPPTEVAPKILETEQEREKLIPKIMQKQAEHHQKLTKQAETESYFKNDSNKKKFPRWIIVIGTILGIGIILTVAFPNGVTWILWVPILIGYGGRKLRLPGLLIVFLIFLCFIALALIAAFDLFMEFGGDEIIDDWSEREKILEGLNEQERLAMSTGITNCQYNAGYYVSEDYGDRIKQDCMEKLARAAENMR